MDVGSDNRVIILASDRRLGMTEIGQKGLEGNRTGGRGRGGKPRVLVSPTFHGTYFWNLRVRSQKIKIQGHH
jgi:hypothetical protein